MCIHFYTYTSVICAFRMCMFWAGGRGKGWFWVTMHSLLQQRWNVPSPRAECLLAHVRVSSTLMVLMHAVAKHWGVALVASHLEKCLKTLIHCEPGLFKKRKWGIDCSLCHCRVFKKPMEGVSLWTARFPSLPGARSDSQFLGSRACQLWIAPLFSKPWSDRAYACAFLQWSLSGSAGRIVIARKRHLWNGMERKWRKSGGKVEKAVNGFNLITRGSCREQTVVCYPQIK